MIKGGRGSDAAHIHTRTLPSDASKIIHRYPQCPENAEAVIFVSREVSCACRLYPFLGAEPHDLTQAGEGL